MAHGGYAVIDVETTGLWPGRHHRVIEIGIVHLDASGAVERSFETVVDPLRDLGPIHVHGLRGADMRDAPRFEHIVDDLADRLRGRVVVAHNARFEAQFLAAEFERLGLVSPLGRDGEGALCTMKLAPTFLPGSGRTLADCCAAIDVDLTEAHEALADATATAELLASYLRMGSDRTSWWSDWADYAALQRWPTAETPRTPPRVGLPAGTDGRGGAGGADDGGHAPGRAAWKPRRRSSARATPPVRLPAPTASMHLTGPVDLDVDVVLGTRGAEPTGARFLERATERLPQLELDRRQTQYAAMLDKALSDGYLAVDEADNLRSLGDELRLDLGERAALHERYFASLVSTVWADGVLSDDERRQVDAVATMLDIAPHRRDAALVPDVIERAPRPALDDDDVDEYDGLDDEAEPLTGATSAAAVGLGIKKTLARFDVAPLTRGDHVTLTGELSRARDVVARELEAAGLVIWPAVTERTALVVAADAESVSGKARKARGYGVPIVDESSLPFVLGRLRATTAA